MREGKKLTNIKRISVAYLELSDPPLKNPYNHRDFYLLEKHYPRIASEVKLRSNIAWGNYMRRQELPMRILKDKKLMEKLISSDPSIVDFLKEKLRIFIEESV